MADSDEAQAGNKGFKLNLGEKIGPWPVWAWAAVIVALGFGVYYYQKKKSAANAAATAAASSQNTSTAPSSGVDPNMVDPNSPTGETYGQEQNDQYGQEDTGYGAYSGGEVTPGGGAFGSYGSPYANLQSWSNAVYNYLVGLGNDPLTVENILAQFENGGMGSLTPQQQSLLDEALAWAGQPPGGVPTNVPPGQGTGGQSQTVQIPQLKGSSAGNAHNQLVALGLKPTAPPGQTAGMKVSRTAPGAGTTVVKGTPVAIFTSGYVSTPAKPKGH